MIFSTALPEHRIRRHNFIVHFNKLLFPLTFSQDCLMCLSMCLHIYIHICLYIHTRYMPDAGRKHNINCRLSSSSAYKVVIHISECELEEHIFEAVFNLIRYCWWTLLWYDCYYHKKRISDIHLKEGNMRQRKKSATYKPRSATQELLKTSQYQVFRLRGKKINFYYLNHLNLGTLISWHQLSISTQFFKVP